MATDSPRYLLGKRRISESYDAGVAASNYAQELERSRESRARQRNQFEEIGARRNNSWAAANRGFRSTGGQQSMRDDALNQAWHNRWAEHYSQNQQRLQQIELQRQQLLRDRDYGLQDLELTETERRMQPAIGGFDGTIPLTNSQGGAIIPFEGNEYGSTKTEEPDNPWATNPYYPYADWNDWARANGML